MTAAASFPQGAAPLDGRQSPAARAIARGVRRWFAACGAGALEEAPLGNGRRADVMAIHPDGAIEIVEIKSCVADFRADRKWPTYRDYCDRLSFAIDVTTPAEIMPEDAGLILADAHGAHLLRPAPEHRLAPARRKKILTQFGLLAAARLSRLHDPDFSGYLEF